MGSRPSFAAIAVACLAACFGAATAASGQSPARDCVRPCATDGPQAPAAESNWEAKIGELEKRIKELEAAKGNPLRLDRSTTLCIWDPVAPAGDAARLTPAAYGDRGQPGAYPVLGVQFPGTDYGPPSFLPAPVANPRLATPPFSGMDEVFTLHSDDGQHTLRITGQIQADYHDYPRHGDTTDLDEFLLRRARLGIEGDLFQYYEYRILSDFGDGKVVMQDCFINIHYWDEFQFMAGKFKEPVSYEELVQDRFVPTVERSIIDQLTPARDVGVMIHGYRLFNDQVEYAFGVFNGEINGDLDTNQISDFAGRIAWRPLNYEALPDYLHLLQIGVSGTTGKEQEPLSLTGVGNETLKTPGGVPFLTFVKNAYANGIRTRVVPELSYFCDQFGFMAEYLRMDQQIQTGTPQVVTTTTVKAGKKVTTTQVINDNPQDIRFDGYQFTATYLLTGEKRTTYSQILRPQRPFDPAHPFSSPGAWELVAQVSHLQVDPSIFQAGAAYQLANPNGNSDAATVVTVGFNWYLNSLVRVQFNWEHAWFQQPLLLGPPSTYFRQTDAVLMRLQLIF